MVFLEIPEHNPIFSMIPSQHPSSFFPPLLTLPGPLSSSYHWPSLLPPLALSPPSPGPLSSLPLALSPPPPWPFLLLLLLYNPTSPQHKLCYIAQNYEAELTEKTMCPDEKKYEMPDGGFYSAKCYSPARTLQKPLIFTALILEQNSELWTKIIVQWL